MASSFKPKYRIVHQTKKNIWKNTKVYKKFFRQKWWFLGLHFRKLRKYKSSYQQKLLMARSFASLTFGELEPNNLSPKKKPNNSDFKSNKRISQFNELKSNLKAWKGRGSRRKNRKAFFNFRRFKFVKTAVLSRSQQFSAMKSYKNYRKKRRLQTLKKAYFKENLLNFQGLRKSLGKVRKKQFYKLYRRLFRAKSNRTASFLNFLDKRFDVSISKVFLNNNIFFGRQLILHGFFTINGEICRSPHFLLKKGDIVNVEPTKWSFVFNYILNCYVKSLKQGKKLLLNNNYFINYSTLTFIFLNDSNLTLNQSFSYNHIESNTFFK